MTGKKLWITFTGLVWVAYAIYAARKNDETTVNVACIMINIWTVAFLLAPDKPKEV